MPLGSSPRPPGVRHSGRASSFCTTAGLVAESPDTSASLLPSRNRCSESGSRPGGQPRAGCMPRHGQQPGRGGRCAAPVDSPPARRQSTARPWDRAPCVESREIDGQFVVGGRLTQFRVATRNAGLAGAVMIGLRSPPRPDRMLGHGSVAPRSRSPGRRGRLRGSGGGAPGSSLPAPCPGSPDNDVLASVARRSLELGFDTVLDGLDGHDHAAARLPEAFATGGVPRHERLAAPIAGHRDARVHLRQESVPARRHPPLGGHRHEHPPSQ